MKLEGRTRVLRHCLLTPPLPAALRFWGEPLHAPVAGVTQAVDARALPCTALPVLLGRCSSADPDGKANTWERRRKPKFRASEPFLCAEPGSPKVEPAVTVQGCFCCGQHPPSRVSFTCPVPPPSPSPRPPTGTRTWLGVQSRGRSGDGHMGFFSFDGEIRVEKCFCPFESPVLEEECQICCEQKEPNSGLFYVCFPPKIISLPASWRVLLFPSSFSSALLCSCFHPLSGQPAWAASILATAVTCQNTAAHSWSLAVLPPYPLLPEQQPPARGCGTSR